MNLAIWTMMSLTIDTHNAVRTFCHCDTRGALADARPSRLPIQFDRNNVRKTAATGGKHLPA
jgi:hypothetical protein